MSIDWQSWRVRIRGSNLEVEVDDDLLAYMLDAGWLKRRLGRLCMTKKGHAAMREAVWWQIERDYARLRRYEEALGQISREYAGPMDRPGTIARKVLDRRVI